MGGEKTGLSAREGGKNLLTLDEGASKKTSGIITYVRE